MLAASSDTRGVDPDRVRHELRAEGFARLSEPCSDADFVRFALALGDVVDDTVVRVVPGKRTYLARPDPIPFHTDHPTARLVAWRCEAQDEIDGAALLVDGRRIIEALDPEARRWLTVLRLPAMVRLGDEAIPTPILSSDEDSAALFYAPWLEPMERPPDSLGALVEFRRALSRAERETRRVRLEAGHVLIVDNRRMLHGRAALMPNSTRRLRRLWIGERGPESRADALRLCPPP